MDHSYAVKKLSVFLEDVNAYLSHIDAARSEMGVEWPDWPQNLVLEAVRASQIINAYVPGLGDVDEDDESNESYWLRMRFGAVQALGHATFGDELAVFLRPTSPSIAADAMHPWVWEPAAPLWAADAHQDAVLAGARVVNRRLQLKLGRHDIGEKDLCLQTFSPTPPTSGKPRLRFEGDRDTPTWKARQEGAMYLSAGAFLGIRNLAAHEEKVTWNKHVALEYLATFSVIARWIEECSKEIAL
ncbi:TIGR02391 family protein [Streptomyces sp. NPDC050507]|uniref:TIGR02391 family protein n=1 Tax=Streptomyces sp. NPDC050507 TaxID=3365619 RepID=UPI00378F0CB9